MCRKNVQFQKISKDIGSSEGVGVLKGQQFLKESMTLNWTSRGGS